MEESLVQRIKQHANSQPAAIPFPPVTQGDIDLAEVGLGFSLPPLLKSIFLTVGNGGFGPGCGLIGLIEGSDSDLGTLVEGYESMRECAEYYGQEWKAGLLPFCEWGCNMFSCVACDDSRYPIFLRDELRVQPQKYTLQGFFENWIKGVDILSLADWDILSREGINPFNREKIVLTTRRLK